ncbi:formin-like protein 8 [Apium graveolens]|uniref:formin-like protein 8 n=1 Tax=Apium graveolens TaxID=4045 RepID=UPI003D79A68A
MSGRRALSSAPPSQDLILKVIALTIASTLLVASVIFYFVYRYAMARERRKSINGSSFLKGVSVDYKVSQKSRALKSLDSSDDGNGVLFLQKLEGGQLDSFSSISFNPSLSEEIKRSNSRHGTKLFRQTKETQSVHKTSNFKNSKQSPSFPSQPMPCNVILVKQSAPPPPPPPPPPPVLPKKFPVPPIPKLPSRKKPPAPPLPRLRQDRSSLRLLTDQVGKTNSTRTEGLKGKSSKGNVEVQMKMKPLHWDKVTANVDHSVVWNEINAGSLRFDDKLIEALFGYNASTPKPSETKNMSSASATCGSTRPAQIFILDPRRSQNTAIILKSLASSCKEIQDAILEGQGLDNDTLEKLTKISPTEDETEKILQFNGNHSSLSYAESFLYQLLKCIPSAFTRINAMLFRSNYDLEILHLKEALQTLEYGCKELRARGIFLKLLEAILRAGNHMNAGTVRGNAKGFNLTALQKISYVKSTDGKITLLEFVVEQIALAEGKRCADNRNHDSESSNTQYIRHYGQDPGSHTDTEHSEKEILKLGLSILGSLRTEYSNVKKAATIHYDSLGNQCSNLTFCVSETKQLMNQCGNDERSDYVKEMKGFIEGCEDELRIVREEQTRVMQLVKRTTEFYQTGACNDKEGNPLQIFIFVRDFLDMVDQACTDIARKHKSVKTVQSSPGMPSPSITAPVMFQKLQSYPTTDKLDLNSFSNSEDDF